MTNTEDRERDARRAAQRLGLQLKKSRRRGAWIDESYMLVDANTNGLASAEHCSLDDVERHLARLA